MLDKKNIPLKMLVNHNRTNVFTYWKEAVEKKKNDPWRQYFTYDLNDVHHQVDRLKEALKSF